MNKSLIQLIAVVALALCASPAGAAFPAESGQAASSATSAETKPAAESAAATGEEKSASAVSSQATSSSGREKSGSKRRNRSSSRQSAPAMAASSVSEPASRPVEEPAAAASAEVYPPSLEPAPSAQPPAPALPAATPAVQAAEAAKVPATPAPAAQEIPSTVSDFPVARVLGALGIVLSLIAGGVFGARKFAPQLFRKATPERNLKIVETLQLGEKRSISVIQVEDKRFLIGSTSSQITLLAPLRGPLSVEDEVVAKATVEPAAAPRAKAPVEKFRNIFEIEKASPARNGGRTKTIPPDVRAKMRQLRESLEQ